MEQTGGPLGTKLTIRDNARAWIKFYFIVIIAAGVVYPAWLICLEITPSIRQLLISGVAFSSCGSAAFYLRKMYKNEINSHFVSIDSSMPQEEIGGILYYVLRPIYASLFSVVFFIVSLGQLKFNTVGDNINRLNFFYFQMVTSFCLGYSIGSILDSFKEKSDKRIENIVKKIDIKDSFNGDDA